MIPKPIAPPRREPSPFYVHPDNWPAFVAFEACQTQWRLIVGMGGAAYEGIEYTSVWVMIKAMGLKKPGKVMQQVRLIEAGALSVMNDRENVSDDATDQG